MFVLKFNKVISVILLLINLLGAFYGGLGLMLKPDGSNIGLSIELIKHSPFHDFFIPGFILLTANGLFSIIVIITIVTNQKNYPLFIIAQGIILTTWIITQVFLIDTVFFLHYLFGGIGVILILSGWFQKILKDSGKHG